MTLLKWEYGQKGELKNPTIIVILIQKKTRGRLFFGG